MAKELIELAKEAGADAAKFQHFRAEKIVSSYGFASMGRQISHQSSWKKTVFQVYQEASVPWEWTPKLKQHADKVGIHFFSAPYDLEAIDMLDEYMPAYKIGSGDINWYESLEKIASKRKPVFLATGASMMEEVEAAVERIMQINSQLCLMQCNTNYTGSLQNFRYIQLNVLKAYAKRFPNVVLGLSDHTPGHSTVLGAVALGARAIEKHFTKSRKQEGPDHSFSMEPWDWREMVNRVRELEFALGTDKKKIEENECETIFIQRRCCRAARNLNPGDILSREDIDVLRPAKPGAFLPPAVRDLVGQKIKKAIPKGEALMPFFF
jgi:N-acetylneuraminate synthase